MQLSGLLLHFVISGVANSRCKRYLLGVADWTDNSGNGAAQNLPQQLILWAQGRHSSKHTSLGRLREEEKCQADSNECGSEHREQGRVEAICVSKLCQILCVRLRVTHTNVTAALKAVR